MKSLGKQKTAEVGPPMLDLKNMTVAQVLKSKTAFAKTVKSKSKNDVSGKDSKRAAGEEPEDEASEGEELKGQEIADVLGKSAQEGGEKARIGGIRMTYVTQQLLDKKEGKGGFNSGKTRFSLNAEEEVLSVWESQEIETAFGRFDTDRTDTMNGIELRMMLRELGWNTPSVVCAKWAISGKKKTCGLDLGECRQLVGSGKLGPRTIREVVGSERHDFKAHIAEKASHHSEDRRYALAPDARGGRGMNSIVLPGVKNKQAPRLDGKANMYDLITGERRKELNEAWCHFDHDKSGFLEAKEFRNSLYGLGLHFDDVTIIRTAHKYGGAISKEAFLATASTQIHYRDELLDVHDMLLGDFHEEDMEGEEGERKYYDASLEDQSGINADGQDTRISEKKALLHMRINACTNKKFRWRTLLTTTHNAVGEHSVGLRLYFDLLALLLVGFAVMSFLNMALMVECTGSEAEVYIARWIGPDLARLFDATVGHLERLDEAVALGFAAQDSLAILLMGGGLILYVVLWIPRAIRAQAQSGRLEDLAIRVDHLPKDLGEEFHEAYAHTLEDHFNQVAFLDYKEGDPNVPDNPVREVVLARDYRGAVRGVLKQTDLLKKERFIDAKLALLKARCGKIKEALGVTDEGDDEIQKQSAEDDLDVSGVALRSTREEQQMDLAQKEMKSWSYMSKKRKLKQMLDAITTQEHDREVLQERMLEIETSRGEHMDMKPYERDVMFAFVVFCNTACRDNVMKRYGWSGVSLCRRFQSDSLKFGAEKPEEDPDDDSDDERVPIQVKYPHDPSLIRWENADLKRAQAKALRCSVRFAVFFTFLCSITLAWACMATTLDVPLLLDDAAQVWVIANLSADGIHPWRVCEVEVFSDAACTIQHRPVAWISSNGMHQWEDSGLQYPGDKNFASTSTCQNYWQPKEYWQSFTTESLGATCAVGSTDARRLTDSLVDRTEEHKEDNLPKEDLLTSADTENFRAVSPSMPTRRVLEEHMSFSQDDFLQDETGQRELNSIPTGIILEEHKDFSQNDIRQDETGQRNLKDAVPSGALNISTPTDSHGSSLSGKFVPDDPSHSQSSFEHMESQPSRALPGQADARVVNSPSRLVDLDEIDGLASSADTASLEPVASPESTGERSDDLSTNLRAVPMATLQGAVITSLPMTSAVKSVVSLDETARGDALGGESAMLLDLDPQQVLTTSEQPVAELHDGSMAEKEVYAEQSSGSYGPDVSPSKPVQAGPAARSLADTNPTPTGLHSTPGYTDPHDASPTEGHAPKPHRFSNLLPGGFPATPTNAVTQDSHLPDRHVQPTYVSSQLLPGGFPAVSEDATRTTANGVESGVGNFYPLRIDDVDWMKWSGLQNLTSAAARRLSSCYWVNQDMNTSVIDLRIYYQSSGNARGKHALLLQRMTDLLTVMMNPDVPEFQLTWTQPHVFGVSGMASAPAISSPTGCKDHEDAPDKLVALLGLEGSEVPLLRSCKDFAILGLLGVSDLGSGGGPPTWCSLLPVVYRCLCATTCRCTCSSGEGGACDCEAPGPGDPILPLEDGQKSTVTTMEFHGELCIVSGSSLVATACFQEIYDSGMLNLGAKDADFKTNGIFATGAIITAPEGRKCEEGPTCRLGERSCISRQNLEVCAVQCNQIEECADGSDELSCGDTTCEAANTCVWPPGRCINEETAHNPCAECTIDSTDETRCKAPGVTAGHVAAGTATQCHIASVRSAIASADICNPSKAAYSPCECLSSKSSAADREPLGCLVRGNLTAALNSFPGLLAVYHFEKVSAGKTVDSKGERTMLCKDASGPSSQCKAEDPGVVGKRHVFRGDVWLISTGDEFPATQTHATIMFVRSRCNNCVLAHLLGGGVLFIDELSHLGVSSPIRTEWKPQLGPQLWDGSFHFIGHSIGPGGEALFVDGVAIANRTWAQAFSAGWSSSLSRLTLGYLGDGSRTSYTCFDGDMDEVAVYDKELSAQAMLNIKLSGSWRAGGPTWLERFLGSTCSDRTVASNNNACGDAVDELLASETACVQGDACGCLEALMPSNRETLHCSIACAGSDSMQRTLLGLLQEQCGDDKYSVKSCETDYDCFIMHPTVDKSLESLKYSCDAARGQCVFKEDWTEPYHSARAKLCIAYAADAYPSGLDNYTALYFMASIGRLNTSNFTSISVTDGCEFLDVFKTTHVDVSSAIILAQNGSFPGVGLASGNLSQEQRDSKLRIGADGSVTHAGGLQTINIQFPQVPGVDSLSTVYAMYYTAMGRFDLIYVRSADMPSISGPVPLDVPAPFAYANAPTPDLVTDASIAVPGPVMYDFYRIPGEVCDMREFECGPGVCIFCPNQVCLCNGWSDCPNGADEDPNYIANTGRIAEACMAPVVNTTGVACKYGNGIACIGTNVSEEICVPTARKCDGISDCQDGRDETDCPIQMHPSDAHTWIGMIFQNMSTVGCVRVSQPVVHPTSSTGLFACDIASVIHPATLTPMRSPTRACRAMGTFWSTKSVNRSTDPKWEQRMSLEDDYTRGTISPPIGGAECPLGLALNATNAIGIAAAYLANNASSPIARCFCEQRMQLEPELYFGLSEPDPRYVLCEETIWRILKNYRLVYIRCFVIMVSDEIFRSGVHTWIARQRHSDESSHIRNYFLILTWGLLANTALLPLVMSYNLPMREWHGLVGTSITFLMILRLVYPNCTPILWMAFDELRRRWKRKSCLTQEMLNDLYTLPHMDVAEAYAEMAVTAFVALIFGPAIPLLNWIAAGSLATRYVLDWLVLLRGAHRPPAYDEEIARDAAEFVILGALIHCVFACIVYTDAAVFPSDSEGCRGEGYISTMPSNTILADDGPNAMRTWEYADLRNVYKCSAVSSTYAVPFLTLLFMMAVLPIMPRFVRFCRRCCRQGGGFTYDDLIAKRSESNLTTTYNPRDHIRYKCAFKLIDLAANYNIDAHADDSSTQSSSDDVEESESENEEKDEHHKALLLAAAIIGKTSMGKNEAVTAEEAMLAKLAEAKLLPMPGVFFKPDNASESVARALAGTPAEKSELPGAKAGAKAALRKSATIALDSGGLKTQRAKSDKAGADGPERVLRRVKSGTVGSVRSNESGEPKTRSASREPRRKRDNNEKSSKDDVSATRSASKPRGKRGSPMTDEDNGTASVSASKSEPRKRREGNGKRTPRGEGDKEKTRRSPKPNGSAEASPRPPDNGNSASAAAAPAEDDGMM